MPPRRISSSSAGAWPARLGRRRSAAARRGDHHQHVLAAVARGQSARAPPCRRPCACVGRHRGHVLEIAQRQDQAEQPLGIQMVGPGLPPWIVVRPQARRLRGARYTGSTTSGSETRLGVAEPAALQQLAHRVRLVAHRELGEIAVAGDLLVGDLEVLHVALDLGRRRPPAGGRAPRPAPAGAAAGAGLRSGPAAAPARAPRRRRRRSRRPGSADLEHVGRGPARGAGDSRRPCRAGRRAPGPIEHSRLSHCNAIRIA